MRIAITGHRELPPTTERLVDQAIRDQLAAYAGPDLVGELPGRWRQPQYLPAVLYGGQIDVIVPAAQYRDGLPESSHGTYDSLLAKASHIDRLDRIESDQEADMEASNAMLSRGRPALCRLGRPARARLWRHSRCRQRSAKNAADR